MKKLILFLTLVYFGQVHAQCTITITGNTVVCAGSCTTFTASGATSYQWMPSGTNSPTITVCPTTNTTYTVDGYGSGGCISTQTISVSVNPGITYTVTTIPESCIGCCDGSIQISNLTGGCAPYQVTVNPGNQLQNLCGSTTYTVTIQDIGCCPASTFTNCVDFGCNTTNITTPRSQQTGITIFPNPTSDQFFIDANTTDKLTVDLYDVNGRHVFSVNVSGKSNIDVKALDKGIYTLTIKTGDHVVNKKLVIVR